MYSWKWSLVRKVSGNIFKPILFPLYLIPWNLNKIYLLNIKSIFICLSFQRYYIIWNFISVFNQKCRKYALKRKSWKNVFNILKFLLSWLDASKILLQNKTRYIKLNKIQWIVIFFFLKIENYIIFFLSLSSELCI